MVSRASAENREPFLVVPFELAFLKFRISIILLVTLFRTTLYVREFIPKIVKCMIWSKIHIICNYIFIEIIHSFYNVCCWFFFCLEARPFKSLRGPITGCTSLTPLERQFCVEEAIGGYSYQTAKYVAIVGSYVDSPELISKIRGIVGLPHQQITRLLSFFNRLGFISYTKRQQYA